MNEFILNTIMQYAFWISLSMQQSYGFNNVIPEWIVPNYTFPKSDHKMICSYDYDYDPDIITIVGGCCSNKRAVYQFNIISNTFTQLPDASGDITFLSAPSSFVTLNNIVYFTNDVKFGKTSFSTSNFFMYDITNHVLSHGTKQYANYGECYTTDGSNYIYVIGGFQTTGVAVLSTSIFNVNSHSWSSGPTLNVGRYAHGCTYSKYDKSLYVFGGSDGNGWFNSIEVYNIISSSQWVTLSAILTMTTRNLDSFVMDYSNTIFIVGGYNGYICNMYSINNNKIDLCPDALPANSFCGIYVDNKQFGRYYRFGVALSVLVNVTDDLSTYLEWETQENNLVEYAQIYPINIDLSLSSSIVLTGDRVPIIIHNEYDVCDLLLICDELNINYTLSKTITECVICGTKKKNNESCFDCSFGILPQYKLLLPHPQTIQCIDVARTLDNGMVTVSNNFDIKYSQQYFNFNISGLLTTTIQTISIEFNVTDLYIVQDHSYDFALIFNFNEFEFNYTLNIVVYDERNIVQCTICSDWYIYCGDCNQPFMPFAQFYLEADSIKLSAQIIPFTNPSNYIVFMNMNVPNGGYTKGVLLRTSMYLNFTNSFTIFPGSSIPIIICDSLIWIDGEYTFDVRSDNTEAFVINNKLTIQVINGSISECKICDSSCIDCQEGIIPSIDSRFLNGTQTMFNMIIEPLSTTESQPNVTIYPLNGVSIAVTLCPRGFGMATTACSNCKECGYNKFTLIPSAGSCISCDSSLKGVECKGEDSIIISYNYWLSALSNNNEIYPLIRVKDIDTMFAVFCPPGFCCNSMSGCNYIDSFDNYYGKNVSAPSSLCAFGRDPSSILCGSCENGKSELFGSTNCGICKETNYPLIILMVLLIILPITTYIVYFDSAPKTHHHKTDIRSKQIGLFNSLLFDVAIYYFQTLSIILSSKGYAVSSWAISLLSIFNMQPSNMMSSNNDSGFCVIGNIDAFQKLLFNFVY
eukprot:473101_1